MNLANASNITIGSTQVSAVYLGNTLIWPSTPQHDYSLDYLTIVSLENNNVVKLKCRYEEAKLTINVSTDNGSTWTSKTPISDAYLNHSVNLATLNTGDKLLIKGLNTTYSPYRSSGGDYNTHWFECTKTYNVEGNIMSLTYGDNFISTIPTSLAYQAFSDLFSRVLYSTSDGLYGANVNLITAENLILPNVVGDSCYTSMFKDCTALTTAPVLPAATLQRWCYGLMFKGCTSLSYIKCLATDKSADSCTYAWCSDSNYHSFSSSGTFVKNSSTSWTTGRDGIPSGWTVQNA